MRNGNKRLRGWGWEVLLKELTNNEHDIIHGIPCEIKGVKKHLLSKSSP